jgi:hypothetical protein
MEHSKMKYLISITTAVVMVICLSTAPAQADRKTREGFLLGVGAVVLGSVIYQGLNQPHAYQGTQRRHVPPAYDNRGTQCRTPRMYDRHPAGRWEARQIWVEPGHDSRWKSDRHGKGKWNNSRHDKFKGRDGYRKEVRVWIGN